MKKKILSIALLMVLFLVGCGSKPNDTETPGDTTHSSAELFKKALENQVGQKNVDMVMAFVFPDISAFDDAKALGMDSMEVATKLKNFNENDLNAIEAHIVTSMGAFSTEVYIKDGYTYTDVFGMKMKEAFALEDTESMNLDLVENYDVEPEILEKFKVTESGENVIYTLVIEDMAAFFEIYGDDAVGEGALSDIDDDVQMVSATMIYTIHKNDAALREISIEFDVLDKTTGETGVMAMKITLNNTDNIEIEYPDFSEYES